MKPRDWSQELTAYVDGELSPEDARAMEAQLVQDPALRALEQRLRRTVAAVEALPAPAPSQALRRAVMNRLDEPDALPWWQAWLRPIRLVPVGVVAVAALTVLTFSRVEQAPGTPADEEQLFLAQNMEVLEDLDVVGLDAPEDVDVIARLHEVEVTP